MRSFLLLRAEKMAKSELRADSTLYPTLPNKTKLKFDKDFRVCWSFCFELKVLNESKYSMSLVRCRFRNVFSLDFSFMCYAYVRYQNKVFSKIFKNFDQYSGKYLKSFWFLGDKSTNRALPSEVILQPILAPDYPWPPAASCTSLDIIIASVQSQLVT